MIYRKVDADYIARHDSKHRLRCYGLDLSQVEHKEIKPVVLEGEHSFGNFPRLKRSL